MLVCEDVSCGYGKGRDYAEVLRNVSCTFAAGTLTAIIGPNGAGKSTLARVLLGVLACQHGRVQVATSQKATQEKVPGFVLEDIAQLSLARRAKLMALVAQRPSVASAMTVQRAIEIGVVDGLAMQTSQRVIRAAKTCDVHELLERNFHELSAGQQQRVALARALAQIDREGEGTASASSPILPPGIIIADEPVASMDPLFAMRSMQVLASHAKVGGTVVVVLHDLDMVRTFADRVVMLGCDGTVQESGTPEQVFNPQSLHRLFGVHFEQRTTLSPVRPIS
jgi:iron complex transport system ATP-binding protein